MLFHPPPSGSENSCGGEVDSSAKPRLRLPSHGAGVFDSTSLALVEPYVSYYSSTSCEVGLPTRKPDSIATRRSSSAITPRAAPTLACAFARAAR